MTRKGKAVAIEHNLFDELWNFGNRKMPAEVQFKESSDQVAENKTDKVEEEKVADAELNDKKSPSIIDSFDPSLPSDETWEQKGAEKSSEKREETEEIDDGDSGIPDDKGVPKEQDDQEQD